MSNYYQSREITRRGAPTGLFHYTVQMGTNGDIAPVGPCANRCPGHETRDAAWLHFRDDALTRMDTRDVRVTECRTCKAPTTRAAEVPMAGGSMLFPLCEAHLNVGVVTTLIGDEEITRVSSY